MVTPEPEFFVVDSVEMSYSAGNRLATYNGEAVNFDADGNMVFGPISGLMGNLGFDSRNRLISAGTTNYSYDAENQRKISKI